MRYLDLAGELRSAIADGRPAALPSEAELGETHGVSRVTVSSTISPSEPRTTIRRANNGFHHWWSTMS